MRPVRFAGAEGSLCIFRIQVGIFRGAKYALLGMEERGVCNGGVQLAIVNSTSVFAAMREPPAGDWSMTVPCGHCAAAT